MLGYFLLAGLMSIIGFAVSSQLKTKFRKYSQIGLRNNRSGAEVAYEMLAYYDIHDVKVIEGQGMLTDHYNPLHKTVSLSPAVFRGRSIAAAAIAAHECGHAVQHATAYNMLQLRSKMVPLVNVANRAQQFLLLAALGLFGVGGGSTLLLITIVAFAVTAVFSLITLPVEYDASNRALNWLDKTGVLVGNEYDGARDALKWAALTYVAAALSALVMVMFLVLRFLGSD
jgi:Zn-dependent membrane protease YugP